MTKRPTGNEVKKAVANPMVKSVKWCGRYWYVVVDVQGVDTDANADKATRDARKAVEQFTGRDVMVKQVGMTTETFKRCRAMMEGR